MIRRGREGGKMKRRPITIIIALLLPVLFFWLWGCEQKLTAPINQSDNSAPTIEDYFPLSTGKSAVYITTNSGYEPDIITRDKFVMGESVEESGSSLYSWVKTSLT